MRSGGSIPIVASFEQILGLKTVLMGFGLDSDAIHSPNEHYGLFNYFKGIETIPHFHAEFARGMRKTLATIGRLRLMMLGLSAAACTRTLEVLSVEDFSEVRSVVGRHAGPNES